MFIRAVIIIICSIGLMFSISPALTGVLIACMTPIAFFAYYFGKKMKEISKEISDNKAIM